MACRGEGEGAHTLTWRTRKCSSGDSCTVSLKYPWKVSVWFGTGGWMGGGGRVGGVSEREREG